MTRRKVDKKAKLVRKVTVRMSESFYERMEGWLANSNCQSLAQLARMILYREEITWYHRDASMDSTLVEIALVRKELNAIGININQITRHFNSADTTNQKIIQALKVVDEYKKVGQKLERVMDITGEITKKWLQK